MTEPVVPAEANVPGWLRYAGALVAVALAFVSAVWEAFLSPLAYHWTSGGHAHSVRVPIAIVLAFGGNAALAWFTRAVTGRTLAVLAPFVAWTVPALLAASRTREGDLIVASNNWVGLVTLFAGPSGFAAVAYWLTVRSLPRPAKPLPSVGPAR